MNTRLHFYHVEPKLIFHNQKPLWSWVFVLANNIFNVLVSNIFTYTVTEFKLLRHTCTIIKQFIKRRLCSLLWMKNKKTCAHTWNYSTISFYLVTKHLLLSFGYTTIVKKNGKKLSLYFSFYRFVLFIRFTEKLFVMILHCLRSFEKSRQEYRYQPHIFSWCKYV